MADLQLGENIPVGETVAAAYNDAAKDRLTFVYDTKKDGSNKTLIIEKRIAKVVDGLELQLGRTYNVTRVDENNYNISL